MPLGRTPITWNMTVRDALLNVINEDMEELFSRVEALELGVLSGVAIATEEEAVAGVDNTKAMTPLRVHQAIAANPSTYLTTVDHTKALHDSLGIDADTLDGSHAVAFRRNDEDINLSQGQIIDFADEVGDKIRLHNTQYGVAINPNELTLYTPSTSEIAVRNSAYNGQKLGDVIHTGNIDSKGVARKLSTIASVPGDFLILNTTRIGSFYIPNNVYDLYMQLYIPWGGVTRYKIRIYNTDNDSVPVRVKINTTEYGPYPIVAGYATDVYIDDANTGAVDILAKVDYGSSIYIHTISVMTGNTNVLQEFMVRWLRHELRYG